MEIYCKLILQVCFHSLYIINLHENGANPSKGFKLLWDQNNVASYNLKQQCTSKSWGTVLEWFHKNKFKFLLCLLTMEEKDNLELAVVPTVSAPTKAQQITKKCCKTSRSSFPCKEDTAMASWAFLDRETGRKWCLKDKKARAAFKIYCIPWAMNVLPQEQPSLPSCSSSTRGLPPSSSWTPALCLDVKVLAHLENQWEMKA